MIRFISAAALVFFGVGILPSRCFAQLYAAAPEPQLFGENMISTGDDESHPAFTADGKTLYFLKNDPSFNHWTIVVSHEQNGKWSTPEVAPFSGQFSDADPFITADGERFFFISTRPVNGQAKEDTDIWMMRKSGPEAGAGIGAAATWSEPEHLVAVNSETNEWFPTVANNGNLYFGSERPGGRGKCDLYVSRLVDGKYQAPENLGDPINTAANEVEPFIAPDESYIIFAGTRLTRKPRRIRFVCELSARRRVDKAHEPGQQNQFSCLGFLTESFT